MGLTLADIGVVEFHEAFAGALFHVIVVLQCLRGGFDVLYVFSSMQFFCDAFCYVSICITVHNTPLVQRLIHTLTIPTGQVLANMVAMGSEKFCAERIPGGKVVGKFNYDNVNTKGGSLSLGHPFGATGTLKCVSCSVC